ncbi:MAG TPA: hypothetical protein VJA25_14635 [Dehalococcoidia bacterium]|nr:hypothetical protein [Anaerolineales bacterium]HLE82486.1 hypothetical protein [Dehalococcoidia bacterium]
MSQASPLNPGLEPEQIEILTNRPEWRDLLRGGGSPFHFESSEGWKGHLEQEA